MGNIPSPRKTYSVVASDMNLKVRHNFQKWSL
jgi:hypothetical protein